MADDLFKGLENITLFSLNILIIIIGVSGNVLVLMAVWKKRQLRSTTNYLLANLAASDLTTLVTITFGLIPELVVLEEGTLADFLCMFFISYHLPITASFVSILTLTVLAVERYHAVVKPMKTGIRLREETVKYAVTGIWTTGIVLSCPFYIFGYYSASSQSCRYSVNKTSFRIFQVCLVIIGIIVPFFTISFCYFQIVHDLYFKNKVEPQNVAAKEDALAKRKLVKLSLTVTGFFVLFLFPIAIITPIRLIDNTSYGKLYRYAVTAFFAEAGINPLIYSFQSTNFRQAFEEILKCS